MNHPEQRQEINGRPVPSQPLVNWLSKQYDRPQLEEHGPWATAWDGNALATTAKGLTKR